jgi:hypothetical protein
MSIGFVWVSISGCSLLVDFPAEDDCGNGVIDEGEQCDDGNHDNSIEPCPDGVGGLNAVWIDADSVAWAVGQAGKILRNGGSGWVMSSSPTTQALHGIWGWGSGAEKEIWIVGEAGTVLRYRP